MKEKIYGLYNGGKAVPVVSIVHICGINCTKERVIERTVSI